MRDYQRKYSVTLTVRGPVHIGSGQELKKKEYIFAENKVYIPDIARMYADMKRKGLGDAFERYLLDDSQVSLDTWLKKNHIGKIEYLKWIRYSLDCGDTIWEKGRTANIACCIKDAYGLPYIPGSSLKGMLRTILLAYEIKRRPEQFSAVKNDIVKGAGYGGRKGCLRKEAEEIETIAFRKLKRDPGDRANVLNDVMAGFIVGDSQPLGLETLVLAQKVDMGVEKIPKALPILRECIKPGTKITFPLTIDTALCPYLKEDIQQAIMYFGKVYNQTFRSSFTKNALTKGNYVWLGGGSGFATKTVVYPLFGKEKGVRTINTILKTTLSQKVFFDHKHGEDLRKGVSPHILKVTRYAGKLYEMGLCSFDIEEIQ